MTDRPRLRVVPLENIRRHEEIDPLRVDGLSKRIAADGIQANPMVCIEAPAGELVLLDGATRTESLKGIGLRHAVVQLVDPSTVTLGTWHHVVRGCSADDFTAAIGGSLGLEPGTAPPAVHRRDTETCHVVIDELSLNATLAALVDRYLGKWTVTRTTDPSPNSVSSSFEDWAAVVEFPTLTIDDVMDAAVGRDLLPAGITRFQVPNRALRLNFPLDLLHAEEAMTDKQQSLDTILEERARSGRIRRYEEPVFILDD